LEEPLSNAVDHFNALSFTAEPVTANGGNQDFKTASRISIAETGCNFSPSFASCEYATLPFTLARVARPRDAAFNPNQAVQDPAAILAISGWGQNNFAEMHRYPTTRPELEAETITMTGGRASSSKRFFTPHAACSLD
jgi:hypothetical protein